MLIEARIAPSQKSRFLSVIKHTVHKFHLRDHQYSVVPHLTLYGPFEVKYGKKREVISAIKECGSEHNPIQLQIDGFGYIRNPGTPNVVSFNIINAEKMDSLRKKMRDRINPIATVNRPWDRGRILESLLGDGYKYHITVAYNLPPRMLDSIWKHVGEFPFKETLDIERITLLNNSSKIVVEYDLTTHRLLERDEALSKEW